MKQRIAPLPVAAILALSLLKLVHADGRPVKVTPQSALPAWFEPNRGQLPAEIAFLGRSQGYGLALDRSGTSHMVLPHDTVSEVVTLELQNGRARSAIGEEQQPSLTRIYHRTAAEELCLTHYGRVRLSEVYPGIDFIWIASGTAFRYEFHLQPQANARRIRLQFSGARSLAVSSAGDLIVHSTHGQLRLGRPVAFQDDGRVNVEVFYELRGSVVALRLARHMTLENHWSLTRW